MEKPSLRGLDPRTKLGAAAILIAGLLLVDEPMALTLFAALIVSAAILVRFPFRFAATAAIALWPVLLLTLFIHGLANPSTGRILVSYASLSVTTTGLAQGGLFAARLVLFIFVSRIILYIGSGEEYARAFAKILSPLRCFRLPVGEVELILGIAFRLIPILEEEAGRLVLARRARGEAASWAGKIRQLPVILVPLFIGAFRRADALAIAMEARGFAVGAPRSSFVEARFRWFDGLILILVVVTTAAAITIS